MVGDEGGDPVGCRAVLFPSQLLDQQSGIDADRAGCRAEAIGRAGLVSLIVERLFQLLVKRAVVFAISGQVGQLAIDHDSLPGRECQVACGALYLTETTFDTFVNPVISQWDAFKVLEEDFRILVQQDARV